MLTAQNADVVWQPVCHPECLLSDRQLLEDYIFFLMQFSDVPASVFNFGC
jgi:hypothetical protein